MKKKLFILFAAFSSFFASCTTYKDFMSEPTSNPISEKFPRLEIDWYSGGDIIGTDVDFVKNIIRGEIYQNIAAPSGSKSGTIEVRCEKIHVKQNLVFAFLSGFTLFSANILGMPYTITNVDMTLAFTISNTQGEEIGSYRYSAQKNSAIGFYYGKDAKVCLVEATKDIMKRFRNDMNADGERITSKLNKGLPKNEPTKKVEGLGNTALEQMIVRWDIQSRPQGADIFWRVVSKTPEVKSTNNKYLMTTPYEATKAIDIKGLTYQTASNVRIILRCEKDGYMPQEKEFDVRMIIDQEEISAFFRLVKE